jgi:hypothetical protein
MTMVRRVPDAVVHCAVCEKRIVNPTVGQAKAKNPCCGGWNCRAELRKQETKKRRGKA